MPVIFVHGVNVRETTPSKEENAAKAELLRRMVLEPLSSKWARPFNEMEIRFSYWGLYGVNFAWDNLSLPNVSTIRDAGPSVLLQSETEMAVFVNTTAHGFREGENFQLTVESLPQFMEAAMAPIIFAEIEIGEFKSSSELGRIEALLLQSSLEAIGQSETRDSLLSSTSLMEALDIFEDATWNNFETKLIEDDSSSENSGVDRLGAGSLRNLKHRFSETINRLRNAPTRLMSVAALDWKRKRIHDSLARFIGDAFVYLTQRGDKENPGPIIQETIKSIEVGTRLKKNEPTIIITHSMGGNILYDILTYYKPELKVDLWISVASQVGLLEEMKLFRSSDPAINTPNKTHKIEGKVPYWLNIYDPADILAFLTRPIFSGNGQDVPFLTGDSMFSAHGAYFRRASFYDLLLGKLSELELWR